MYYVLPLKNNFQSYLETYLCQDARCKVDLVLSVLWLFPKLSRPSESTLHPRMGRFLSLESTTRLLCPRRPENQRTHSLRSKASWRRWTRNTKSSRRGYRVWKEKVRNFFSYFQVLKGKNRFDELWDGENRDAKVYTRHPEREIPHKITVAR